MKKILVPLLGGALFLSALQAKAELIEIESKYSVKQTVENLTSVLKAKGMTLFTVVNHAKGAKGVGLKLKPNTMVMFGNPKVGTKLMQCDARMGLALPLKMLVSKDAMGKTWLTYQNPQSYAAMYELGKCDKVLNKVSGAMRKFANKATN